MGTNSIAARVGPARRFRSLAVVAVLFGAACSSGGSSGSAATDPVGTGPAASPTAAGVGVASSEPAITAGATTPSVIEVFVPSGPMCPPTPTGRIAYESERKGAGADGADLWTVQVVQPDGNGGSMLLGGAQYSGIGQPSWSPDGTRAVVIANEGGSDELLVVRCDGTIESVLEGLEMETASYPIAIESPSFPSWSPDGSTIAFTSADGLFLVDPAYAQPVREVNEQSGSQMLDLSVTVVRGRASWSPDGTRLVFGATDQTGNTDVYAIGIDGSNLTRLTTDAGDDYQPAWSPDGTRIAFRSARDGKLWMMNADGTEQQPLFSGEGAAPAYQPAWSPDGTQLVYVSGEDGDTRIHVMGADGNGDRQLTAAVPSPRYEGWPVWIGT